MSETRLPLKVGLFVLLGVALLGSLLLIFSKGASIFTPTYTLKLRADSVGGLKSRSAVLVSGVEVGNVGRTILAPDGRSVTILLKIQKRYRVYRDARFTVEQIGLLGDQYVVIRPTENKGPVLQNGDQVDCESPFNLQEVARTTVGFIERVDQATRMIKDTIERINKQALSDKTLNNLADGVDNFRRVSHEAVSLVENLNHLVKTNSPSILTSATNLARFTDDLNRLAADLRQTVAENREGISNSVTSLSRASTAVGQVARDLEAGKGVAGGLLKDEELRRSLTITLLNLEAASSNVANYGLLYKPRRPKKVENTGSREPARSPKYQ
jgi:phospholipid/cholesterol/gamma-HCH transport system substrate-binding protein